MHGQRVQRQEHQDQPYPSTFRFFLIPSHIAHNVNRTTTRDGKRSNWCIQAQPFACKQCNKSSQPPRCAYPTQRFIWVTSSVPALPIDHSKVQQQWFWLLLNCSATKGTFLELCCTRCAKGIVTTWEAGASEYVFKADGTLRVGGIHPPSTFVFPLCGA